MAPRKPDRTAEHPDTDAFLAWLEKVPDPVTRYQRATAALVDHQRAIERLSALRAAAAADAAEDDSLSSVAKVLGVSRQRVHQLVREAKAQEKTPSGTKRPARRKGTDSS